MSEIREKRLHVQGPTFMFSETMAILEMNDLGCISGPLAEDDHFRSTEANQALFCLQQDRHVHRLLTTRCSRRCNGFQCFPYTGDPGNLTCADISIQEILQMCNEVRAARPSFWTSRAPKQAYLVCMYMDTRSGAKRSSHCVMIT